jgi:prepilin-type N-terminal cleavage/methylation domain-containing protein/prepilin-type processing-associated H-X9-DG protein
MQTLSPMKANPMIQIQLPRFSGVLRFRRGLTLMEILIVITIIVVLALVGMSVVGKLRNQAKSVVCTGNLKQVGSAILMYSSDNNDQLLPLQGNKEDGSRGDIWPMVLAKAGYLWDTPNVGPPPCGKGVWTCPSCDFMSNAYGAYGIVEGIFNYPENSGAGPKRMSSISRPNATWLIGDVMQRQDPKKGWYAIWKNPGNWASGHGPAEGRHGSNRTNVCMFDGHVESLTTKELKNGKYTYADKATAP